MHRDIKPENILVKNEKSLCDIILTDFGLASCIINDPDKFIFKRCGTPGYVKQLNKCKNILRWLLRF